MLDLITTNLAFKYSNHTKFLFKNVNLQFEKHSLNLITGENGCGKSTFLRILSGLKKASEGKVLLNNQDISQVIPCYRVQYVSYLPQNPRHFFTFKTGLQQLRFALENINLTQDEIQKRIDNITARLNLQYIINQPITTLSGGEIQRLAFALVMCINAEYILLDEPLANLDQKNREEILAILKILKQDHTIIIADHDLSLYAELLDNLYYFDAGKIIHKKHPQLSLKRNVPRVTNSISGDNSQNTLTFRQLNITYPQKEILTAANFNFPKGKLGLLCGKNGSGKSTLLNALTKQCKYNGTICYCNKDQNKMKTRKWLQYVNLGFQNSENQFIKTTVLDELNAAYSITQQNKFWNDQRLNEWIDRLSLKEILKQSPYYISGGQQKKVQLLILALICAPVILLDEVFVGLDQDSIYNAMELLREIANIGCSILVVDHQLSQPENYDYVIKLQDHHLFLLEKGAIINE